MNNHKDLEVRKQSLGLAKWVYELTGAFPKDEQFGLTSQMRRAAVSIPSSIAEGAARQGRRQFAPFLPIALGSASELDTQAEIARRIGFGSPEALMALQHATEQFQRLLYGLIRSLKARQS